MDLNFCLTHSLLCLLLFLLFSLFFFFFAVGSTVLPSKSREYRKENKQQQLHTQWCILELDKFKPSWSLPWDPLCADLGWVGQGGCLFQDATVSGQRHRPRPSHWTKALSGSTSTSPVLSASMGWARWSSYAHTRGKSTNMSERSGSRRSRGCAMRMLFAHADMTCCLWLFPIESWWYC